MIQPLGKLGYSENFKIFKISKIIFFELRSKKTEILKIIKKN